MLKFICVQWSHTSHTFFFFVAFLSLSLTLPNECKWKWKMIMLALQASHKMHILLHHQAHFGGIVISTLQSIIEYLLCLPDRISVSSKLIEFGCEFLWCVGSRERARGHGAQGTCCQIKLNLSSYLCRENILNVTWINSNRRLIHSILCRWHSSSVCSRSF